MNTSPDERPGPVVPAHRTRSLFARRTAVAVLLAAVVTAVTAAALWLAESDAATIVPAAISAFGGAATFFDRHLADAEAE